MTGTKCAQITRAQVVMQRFGIVMPVQSERQQWLERADLAAADLMRLCGAGRIVLVSGASGSGKSLLLKRLAARCLRSAVVSEVELPDAPTCDCLPWLELEDALEVLARFGLGEVYTYLSPARLLSTGQQYRLRLALAYGRLLSPLSSLRRNGLLIADEFVTQLDPVSAAVVARNLRKAISAQSAIGAVVATCRDDVLKALKPDAVVRCDFGEYRSEVARPPRPEPLVRRPLGP